MFNRYLIILDGSWHCILSSIRSSGLNPHISWQITPCCSLNHHVSLRFLTMANLGYNKNFSWVLLKTDIPPQNMATQNFSVPAMDFSIDFIPNSPLGWRTRWLVACRPYSGRPGTRAKVPDVSEKKKSYRYSNFKWRDHLENPNPLLYKYIYIIII